MSIITKYIITDLLKKILFLTVGFMLLFAFFSFIADIENVTNKNVNFRSIVFSQTLNLPNIIYDVIPLATLIGSLWSFSNSDPVAKLENDQREPMRVARGITS